MSPCVYLCVFYAEDCVCAQDYVCVCVCALHSDLQGSGGRRLCVTIEPALLLKGDIMVGVVFIWPVEFVFVVLHSCHDQVVFLAVT